MKLIHLTQNKYAIVDDKDYEWLMQWKWYAHKSHNTKDTFYAQRAKRTKEGRIVVMHREILGLKFGDGNRIDHCNGNGLDNQRCNLRLCTTSQNQMNRKISGGSSRFKGVRVKRDGIYAYIGINNKKKYLGSFKTEIDAAKAYDDKARELFGEYANCNFN